MGGLGEVVGGQGVGLAGGEGAFDEVAAAAAVEGDGGVDAPRNNRASLIGHEPWTSS